MNAISRPIEAIRKLRQSFLPQASTPEPGLVVSYVTDKASVRKYYSVIAAKTFHKDEVWPFSTVMGVVKANECAVIVVRENGQTLGGVIVQHFWSTGKKIMLVTWLAVEMEHRSRNIGTLLISEALSYAQRNGASILLGVVEDPRLVKGNNPVHGDACRRVKFYSRFDCQRLEVPFFVPAFEEDQEPTRDSMLALFPLSESQRVSTELFLPELAVFASELIGHYVDEESVAFIEACEKTIALTPFEGLLTGAESA